jgi:hypothetical protein
MEHIGNKKIQKPQSTLNPLIPKEKETGPLGCTLSNLNGLPKVSLYPSVFIAISGLDGRGMTSGYTVRERERERGFRSDQ